MTINILEEFGYCIWLLPQIGHKWYNYTNGFKPHITIDKYLGKKSVQKKGSVINFNTSVNIKLVGKLYQTKTNNFYALQYNVECDGYKPIWWPDDAHISFRYKYHIPFTEDEINTIDNKIIINSGVMDIIQITHCIGDFSTWKKITI
jgi:hypothetical protein